MAIDTEKMKALAADLRKGSSGRYKWYAMGRDETSYFMDFDWGYDADRWFSDQQKSRAAWIEQEGIHIVKKLFQTELETNASEAADAIDTLLAALEAAAADKREMIDLLKQIPQTPEQMIDFIGSNFNSMEADGWTDDKFPPEPTGDLYNVKYSLTVHDLLSAFSCHGFEDAVTLSQRQEES
ncbi:hypothetical protein [Burkholderia multivorans]|uniref:hypothetical protein n=1 Tax=Burkholderia multivorans TaxID=87883 RepID=UPI001C22E6BB|nr:hypothetical protein [Burkholderia multivorans]MBU9312075.1 hypothetical protein [Burkholderia multivorans]